jgi:hypothetical protein
VNRILCCCLLLIGIVGTPAGAQATCDRACLRATLDRYLAAVIKHDPGAAPLRLGFRQTENALVVAPGGGVWKTASGLGALQRRYLDPVSGQAAYFGILEEGAQSAVVTLRLRVEDRAVSEAEWYLARPGDPGLNGPPQPGRGPANLFNPEYLTANPPPERVVPRTQRTPRASLLAIVNSYFDGISAHDGSVVLAHRGCTRVENGTMMTGARGRGGRAGGVTTGAAGGGGAAGVPPTADATGGGSASGGTAPDASNDCTSGFGALNIQFVAARRFPLVDEEAGVVLATAVFIRPPGSANPRNAFSEWFVIDDGRIRSIYSAMFYPPATLPVPNWPPYDGNWPLPAAVPLSTPR